MSMKTLEVLPAICCGPEADPLTEPEREELAARFKALADPTRVAIVNCLSAADEVCVCNLTATFDLSQPTVSHHLKILRDAGLVVTMGCGDVCPVIPGKRHVDWDLRDPAGEDAETIRVIRDEIERRVADLPL